MSEVGSGKPFDVMVRGEYRPEKGKVDSFNIGSEAVNVEADIASFDLTEQYFRVYNVDFFPPAFIGREREVSKNRKLSTAVRGLQEDWGYELSSIAYDNEASLDEDVSPVQGTVYWPDSEEAVRDDVYEDFVDLLGSDVLSRL